MSELAKWMTTDLLSASPRDTVLDACQRMRDRKVGSLIVLEGKDLAGIFTERDVLNKVVAGEKDPKTTTLVEVMTARPQTAHVYDSGKDVYDRMLVGGFRHMPVVDEDGHVIGMLSIKDLGRMLEKKAMMETLLDLSW